MVNLKAILAGAWVLESYLKRAEDGSVAFPMGEQPQGMIMYTPDGYMSVQIMDSERALFASDNLHEKTAPELSLAAASYFAYSGLYEVEIEPAANGMSEQSFSGLIKHHMQNSLFPNWVGCSLLRRLHLQGDRLELSTCQASSFRGKQMTTHLVWRKRSATMTDSEAVNQQFRLIAA
ncbi:lipocalin-like domain-containing protein [Iodobacter sp. HSC-16F04]|uniref:Lipocalin-like domain-containing protein n=1 Tax=Iodobacter violaceini TaxID=3044271 RepID=A0ABX0L396_9NEIS|nr:lipocalin-like domain-containing protein [Iodobacter violacea]NHQ87901.1 lipocalin-like domain-containing protein [Iodobacter violacea]